MHRKNRVCRVAPLYYVVTTRCRAVSKAYLGYAFPPLHHHAGHAFERALSVTYMVLRRYFIKRLPSTKYQDADVLPEPFVWLIVFRLFVLHANMRPHESSPDSIVQSP